LKLRLFNAAVAFTAAVALTTGVSPAQAAPSAPDSPSATNRTTTDIATILAAVKKAYDIYKSFAQGGTSGQDATALILNAIQSAQTAIISHIDAIATAEARACARSAVVDLPNFEALTTDNRQAFALAATSCVTRIESLLGTVTDLGAVDQLGFSLNAVGPIALITRSRTGLTNPSFVPVLVSSNQTVVTRLAPACHPHTDLEGATEYICLAYNGDRAVDFPLVNSQNAAMQRTSWPVAKSVLPQLTSL
jgi:hypothetical protein